MAGRLQHEIKKQRPFESLEQEVLLNLMRTCDQLAAEFNELFKPFGLSSTQYNVLRILRGAGAGCCDGGHYKPDSNGLACREVAERMIARDPDMTRLLDRLEARGFIVRWRETDDRRVIKTRITEAGLEMLKQLDGPVTELHRRQLAHVSREKLVELNELLELMRTR